MIRAVAVVLAAGSGERMGGRGPKAFLAIGGVTMLERTLRTAAACPQVDGIVAVVPAGLEEAAMDLRDVSTSRVRAIAGGDSRQASVAAALAVTPRHTERIVCHDAARPFASSKLFSAVIGALDDAEADGAVPVIPVTDTLKRVTGGIVVATEPRDELALAQTPQAFSAAALREAHARAAAEHREFTDDAAAVEWAGYRVVTVPGEPDNMKITTPMDLARAEAIVKTGGALG